MNEVRVPEYHVSRFYFRYGRHRLAEAQVRVGDLVELDVVPERAAWEIGSRGIEL